MAAAKAISGLSSGGIHAARGLSPRLDGVGRGDLGGVRGGRRGLASGLFAVEPGDQIFERGRAFGEFVGALRLSAERVLGQGQRLLARGDERGQARLVGVERTALGGEIVALARNRIPGLGEGVEVVARRFDLRFQLRNERA